nr:MAG TPA: Laminin subunit alpha-5, Laminin subunit, integrin, extracellular matrix protein [Caudoviricetes sp.]
MKRAIVTPPPSMKENFEKVFTTIIICVKIKTKKETTTMFVIIRKSTLENYKKRIENLEKKVIEQHEEICEYEVKIQELKDDLKNIETIMIENRNRYVIDTAKLNKRLKELEKRVK